MSHSIVSKIFLSKLGSAKLKESLIFTMSYLQLTVLVEIKLQEMDWIRHGNFVKLTTSPMMVLLCATGTALNLLGNGQPSKLAFAQCSAVGCWGIFPIPLKFGFSEKAIQFEKLFMVLLTRASCALRATANLSKSWRRLWTSLIIQTLPHQSVGHTLQSLTGKLQGRITSQGDPCSHCREWVYRVQLSSVLVTFLSLF